MGHQIRPAPQFWEGPMVNFLWDNLFRREKDEFDLIHLLSDCFLFADLNGKELKFIRDIVHQRIYRPSEPIFRQGELGVGMYLIFRGHVDIIVESSEAGGTEPKPVFVTQLEAGDFFGEISLVEEAGRRTASAIAVEETQLVGFFKPDLYEVMSRNPAMGVKILNRLAMVLGRRLKETASRVTELKRELKNL